MTLNEAIRILKIIEKDYDRLNKPHSKDAVKLGIEALKRVKLQHDPAGCTTERLLPGETED